MIVSEARPPRVPARLVAVIVAVVLVAGSFAFRRVVLEDDDEPSNNGGGGNGGGRARIACIAELSSVCAALDADVVVEAAGTTADRLSSGDDVEIDGWVTYAPWAGIVRARREAAGLEPLFDDVGDAIARSPLVFAARQDRAATLGARCGDVTWTCVGEVAGTPWVDLGGNETWGTVHPAHAEAATSGDGLVALGSAVGSFVATPEIDVDHVSRIDWETNDAFPGWFQRLERSIPADAFTRGRDPFTTWLQRRLAGYDIVATTEAHATTRLQRAAPDLRGEVTLLYPAPMATADVVFVPIGDAGGMTAVVDALTEALGAANWKVGDALASLPETDGLPAPGALDALRGLWEGVAR